MTTSAFSLGHKPLHRGGGYVKCAESEQHLAFEAKRASRFKGGIHAHTSKTTFRSPDVNYSSSSRGHHGAAAYALPFSDLFAVAVAQKRTAELEESTNLNPIQRLTLLGWPRRSV